MRINVNPSCNVLTGEHTKSIYAKAEITIPSLRANLSIREARVLAEHLVEAVRVAEEEEARCDTGNR